METIKEIQELHQFLLAAVKDEDGEILKTSLSWRKGNKAILELVVAVPLTLKTV